MEDLRYQHTYHPVPIEQKCPALAHVLNEISAGKFGDGQAYESYVSFPFPLERSSAHRLNCNRLTYRLLNTVRHHDHYLLTEDFQSYIDALKLVDEAYLDQTEWLKKSITTCARMGKFSSDRAILDYAEEYWSIEPLKVE